ncbi:MULTISPECIES: hypothetical protein [Phaeobacter]|uniref:Uncharacterized protein n=3 Tax=Phaeobacter TaxID=302485 RepID=A0AAD0EEZ9_9RHOB|nr:MULTISPECIES: hypothetical protein [Phaeobacter]AHD12039.1 hypothetical protein Gal_04335 [Phaeobacter gallaeciensis DSM 26640]ATE99528.1 hypothetical protein PhaeoP73_04268 [Phaeobacter gallaeciensis]ATF08118.1 hypothetical protein PhaeoP63_04087 [Phaeobacter gallaeciensis]ATG45846.1 hypothetical protein PhaeoP13_03964 [Phaeobacter piscinae]AUR01788.1 hypothetical protein PhaeoP88_04476 [Phaeobacter inhibens]
MSANTFYNIIMTGVYPPVYLADFLDRPKAERAVAALNAQFGDASIGRSFEITTGLGDHVSGWQDMTRETWHHMLDTITKAVREQVEMDLFIGAAM